MALLLGDGSAMDRAEWDAYVRTGVVHALAISGQHLAILAGFLWIGLEGVGRPPDARGVGRPRRRGRLYGADRDAAVRGPGDGHGGGGVRRPGPPPAGVAGQRLRPGVAGRPRRQPDRPVHPRLSAVVSLRLRSGLGRRSVGPASTADAAGTAHRRVPPGDGPGIPGRRESGTGDVRDHTCYFRGQRPAPDRRSEPRLPGRGTDRAAGGTAHLGRAGGRVPADVGFTARAGGPVRGADPVVAGRLRGGGECGRRAARRVGVRSRACRRGGSSRSTWGSRASCCSARPGGCGSRSAWSCGCCSASRCRPGSGHRTSCG